MTIKPLVRGATYYFVATASNSGGLESDPSNEVSYTVPLRPGPPGVLRLVLSYTQGAGAELRGMAEPGTTYTIEASAEVRSGYEPIGGVTTDADGAFLFLDPEPAGRARFYRLL